MHVQISVVTAMKNSSQWVLEQPKKVTEAQPGHNKVCRSCTDGKESSGHSIASDYGAKQGHHRHWDKQVQTCSTHPPLLYGSQERILRAASTQPGPWAESEDRLS